MSSRRSASIYILIGTLLVVGILIFAFKDRLLSYLSARVFGAEQTAGETALHASAASVINLEILDNKNFEKLSDNVIYFDFNQVGKPVPNNTNLQAPAWQAVYLGNANPFLVKEKDKN